MGSKITDKTRVKISWSDIKQIKETYYKTYNSTGQFIDNQFRNETGLKKTSNRYVSAKDGYNLYYFRIVDEQKYMLAKIKYGI
jgi:hypothetical protein